MSLARTKSPVVVFGDNGVLGEIHEDPLDAATASVQVMLSDGRRLRVPRALLRPQADGRCYLPLGPQDIPGVLSDDQGEQARGAETVQPQSPVVIPLVAEKVDIHTRRVETGTVRITKKVETEEEVVNVQLSRDEVTVERVPLGRIVTEPPSVRHEGDVMIVPVMEEVLVVEKRLMLREELRITTRRKVSQESRNVALRKETALVERVPPNPH